MKRIIALIPEYMRIPLCLAFAFNLAVYYGARLITQNGYHHRLILPLDGKIPLLPWTVCIYLFSFIFWAVNYTLAARRTPRQAYRLFCADFIAKIICLLLFVALPTETSRPEISGSDVWSALLRLLYTIDQPNNLFPSIHCIASFLSAVGIATEKTIPLWYRLLSFAIMLAICISTVTTKQHLSLDVLGGILLAAVSFAVSNVQKILESYIKQVLQLRFLLKRKS